MRPVYPWAAIVGQRALRRALVLAAIDPGIGGVLIRGPRGVAKTTFARALADLVPGRFVELPLGATEERVAGTLSLDRALRDQQVAFAPGLLASADGGVLYIDEVNLLADHLVDLVLDAAATGRHHVERDGISHAHSARFVLIGTMNPDEGELRPQLLDRFGLTVEAHAADDASERGVIVGRRLAFDADSDAFLAAHADAQAAVVDRCRRAREKLGGIRLPDAIVAAVTERCHAERVASLRADLAWLRAARALAAWRGLAEITEAEVDAVAELALAHRRPDGTAPPPLPPPAPSARADGAASRTERDPHRMDRAHADDGAGTHSERECENAGAPDADRGGGPGREGTRGASSRSGDDPRASKRDGQVSGWGALPPDPLIPDLPDRVPGWLARGRGRGRETSRAPLRRDDPGGARSDSPVRVDWPRTLARGLPRSPGDLVRRREVPLRARLLLVALDVSASMGRHGGAARAAGIALGLERAARQSGRPVEVVAFRAGDVRTLVLGARASSEREAARTLSTLMCAGGTALVALLDHVIARLRDRRSPAGADLVVVTDGRTREDLRPLRRRLDGVRVATVLIDCERGVARLGWCRRLAEQMGARCVRAEDLYARRIPLRHFDPRSVVLRPRATRDAEALTGGARVRAWSDARPRAGRRIV